MEFIIAIYRSFFQQCCTAINCHKYVCVYMYLHVYMYVDIVRDISEFNSFWIMHHNA